MTRRSSFLAAYRESGSIPEATDVAQITVAQHCEWLEKTRLIDAILAITALPQPNWPTLSGNGHFNKWRPSLLAACKSK